LVYVVHDQSDFLELFGVVVGVEGAEFTGKLPLRAIRIFGWTMFWEGRSESRKSDGGEKRCAHLNEEIVVQEKARWVLVDGPRDVKCDRVPSRSQMLEVVGSDGSQTGSCVADFGQTVSCSLKYTVVYLHLFLPNSNNVAEPRCLL
jgi:hypothetical protein